MISRQAAAKTMENSIALQRTSVVGEATVAGEQEVEAPTFATRSRKRPPKRRSTSARIETERQRTGAETVHAVEPSQLGQSLQAKRPNPSLPRRIVTPPDGALITLKECPFRSLAWRWKRAELLLQGVCRLRSDREDALVLRIVASRQNKDIENILRLPLPLLDQALALHHSQGPQKDLLEAWLLTKIDSPFIADKLNLGAELIDLYHDVFFDVRLATISYVMHSVFGDKLFRCDMENDTPMLIKLIAHNGGRHVLDEYLWYLDTPSPAIPHDLRRATIEELQHLRRWYTIRQFELSHLANPATDRERILFHRAVYRI